MSKAIKVLVIEDSEDDAKLAMRMLTQGGFDPTYRRVQDIEALKAALEQENWDAVLSDFQLPGFNGVEAFEIFQTTGLDIPFIFFSGHMIEETAVAVMRAGASDYVMKQNMARLAPALERELVQAKIRAEHRKSQIELKVSRDRYVDLYDFAPVGFLTLSAEGLITQANLATAEMLGKERDRLLLTKFAQFVLPADTDRWSENFLHALQHSDKQRFELALQSSKGGCLHVQLDSICVNADDAAPTVRIAMTDISDRKTAEAELRRLEAQLREVQKMESIGTLAGGIAHDFNNILGAILGNVALASEEVGAGHPALTSLKEIQKSSVRARDLVQQILTFSRKEPQKLVEQLLQTVVEETHRLLRATLPAQVELSVALTDKLLYVLADATQLQQVLMNLCMNAWHSLNGDTRRIEIGLDTIVLDVGTAQRLGSMLPGPHAHLWVSDTGSGMNAATREHIFEPFFTTKPMGKGTGLGLSVVHGILSAHHGAIAVESEPGQGSTFHLYFPLTASKPAIATAETEMPASVRGHGEHVLYVDDDETMLIMVERILEQSGYRVSGYHDAREAVAAVRENPDTVDLVVTDFNMPEFSGLDVARKLARIKPRLPVVISSGYITEELRKDARLAGARGLLEKQNTFEELSDLVGRILQQDAEKQT